MKQSAAAGLSIRRCTFLAGGLLLSVCLCLFSCGPDTVEETLLVPVRPVHLPEDSVCANCPLKDLEITVTGPPDSIAALSPSEIGYPLDCSGLSVGTNSITIDPGRLPLENGITVRSTTPEFMVIQLERQLDRNIPVEIRTEGQVAKGYTVTEMLATPAEAAIKGPSTAVAALDRVGTKPVSIAGRKESFSQDIPLELPENVTLSSPGNTITVEIGIVEKVVTREYRDLPVTVSDPDLNASVTPQTVAIRLAGPEKTLDRLEREKGLQVVVDIDDPKPGITPRPAKIALPRTVLLLESDPEIFTVTITP